MKGGKNKNREKLLGLTYYIPYQQNIKGYIVDGSDFIEENEGTGLVHLAPAFGAEDFAVAQREKLVIDCPIEANGFFNEQIKVFEFIGKHYSEVNDYVIEDLQQKNIIVKKVIINHSYPHDGRDKSPLFYRLTKQGFINLEKIRNDLLENVEKVQGYPNGTKEKMKKIMEARGDGCLSRQRKGGVPLPILYHDDKPVLNPLIIDYIAELIYKKGSDCGFDGKILPFLQEKFPNLITKETVLGQDTMDVWFDSGVSHGCVVNKEIIK